MPKEEQPTDITSGKQVDGPVAELIPVDKTYLTKRINDLINANQEVFNEYYYLKGLLAPKLPQEVKE